MKLKSWLETRRSAKHRAEIAKMLRSLGMTDLKSFIDVSLGLTLTDTLWVKEEHSDADWNSVNLYDNEFSELVSKTVFMGGISDFSFKTTSPEFITYCADAFASFLIYFLYKKAEIHPFRSITVCIGLGCVGFLLTYAANYIPELSYIACALIGFGMVTCQMLPLYNVVLMKTYPSRFLSPITIGLALVAVLVQSSMVELFRSMPSLLCLAYAVIMVILAVIYLQIEPFFLYTLHRNTDSTAEPVEEKSG